MKTVASIISATLVAVSLGASPAIFAKEYNYVAGDPSLQEWLLPDTPPPPFGDKPPTAEQIELGKQLFFDTRISRSGNMSCATCHSPMFGWSDGLPKGVGFEGKELRRASPVVTNTAYNSIQMWDGRKRDLVDQATGPMEASVEMNTDFHALKKLLNNKGYTAAFNRAFPGEKIEAATAAKAIAAFESTVISNNSPFDKWVKGDASAMTEQQVRGFKIFVDPAKGNCSVCHSAPNFTDNGFHNIGLASYDQENPDMGRYEQKPIRILKGAFKTPTMRDASLSGPYFHDGSATTLMEVVEHYNRGGVSGKDLSPNIKPLNLTEAEKEDLVAFMLALTTPPEPFVLPTLPLE